MEKLFPIILELLAVIIMIMITRIMPTTITTNVVAITTSVGHTPANVRRDNSDCQQNLNL